MYFNVSYLFCLSVTTNESYLNVPFVLRVLYFRTVTSVKSTPRFRRLPRSNLRRRFSRSDPRPWNRRIKSSPISRLVSFSLTSVYVFFSVSSPRRLEPISKAESNPSLRISTSPYRSRSLLYLRRRRTSNTLLRQRTRTHPPPRRRRLPRTITRPPIHLLSLPILLVRSTGRQSCPSPRSPRSSSSPRR